VSKKLRSRRYLRYFKFLNTAMRAQANEFYVIGVGRSSKSKSEILGRCSRTTSTVLF
jgi:hypothetical protein